jgi:hypothetical protein
MSPRLQVFALVFVIILGTVAAQFPHWLARTWSVLCGIMAVGLLFFRETHIDIERRIATEVTRLLGIIPLPVRERAFAEFQAIRCFCHSSSDISDTWVVALRPRRGHETWVRKFSTGVGDDCPAARDFAHELSATTGLELLEDAS